MGDDQGPYFEQYEENYAEEYAMSMSVSDSNSTMVEKGYNTVALTYEELDGFVNDHCYKDADSLKWKCTLCDQTSLYKTDVVRHIEAKHVTLPELVCNVCGKTSKTRDSL